MPLIAVNSILVVIFGFKLIEKIREIFNISIILFAIILYLIVVKYFLRAYEEDEFIIGVHVLNYGFILSNCLIGILIILIYFLLKNYSAKKIKMK